MSPLAKPAALLFDLDGVLADVSGSFRRAIGVTATSFGVAIGEPEIRAAKDQGDANDDWELTRRLLAAHGVEVPLAEVIRRFRGFYEGTAEQPGLRASERLLVERGVIERIARARPIALVTGRSLVDARHFLRQHAIEPWFRALATREDGMKPDPAPVRAALARLGVAAGNAWMVGDLPDDMRAAVGAGVTAIGVIPPGETRERFEPILCRAGASAVIDSAAVIEALLA